MIMRSIIITAVAVVKLLTCSAAFADGVLERVRSNGVVRCGIDQTPGFSAVDAAGRAHGFDIDFCRAIAAAVLGSPDAIEPARVNTANKFKGLVDGDLDVAFGMTTWTMTRDTALGVSFPGVVYYDGQGFMAWGERGKGDAAAIAGKRICVQGGTTSQGNLLNHLHTRNIAATLVESASSEEKFRRFMARDCEVVTGDRAELAGRRAAMAGMRDQLVIARDVISREPLGPVVGGSDRAWYDVVRWVMLATMVAEYKGVTAAMAAERPESADREIRRLLGHDPDAGKGLGLDALWAQRVIAAVGHYGEIFERNLGTATPIGLERGPNALWVDGGLIYAPPFQ